MTKLIHIHPGRIIRLKEGNAGSGCAIYWMSRDQRAGENWALLEAARNAKEMNKPLVCVFTLASDYPGAYFRHFAFMLKGLRETAQILKRHGIPFVLIKGFPPDTLAEFIRRNDASILICDFDPLKIKQNWKHELLPKISIPVIEVDAHNIIPCRIASHKQETGAYTLRPKIARLLDEYLDLFPELPVFKEFTHDFEPVDFESVLHEDIFDRNVGETDSFIPGHTHAEKTLNAFIKSGLNSYNEKRNDPNGSGVSGLSPYLHFGQISAQKIVLDIFSKCEPSENRKAFLEQMIIRRELADNFCFYNSDYDNEESFPAWAKRSHAKHSTDPREFIYSSGEFENARTHDTLWNAAQTEMMKTGKMHNYMRMYWAKKILEWTPSPSDAMKIAVYLNDKYSLDGRDPGGYTGCAWSIGGVHDRAWFDRPVFGQIRYMNFNGCRRKFDVEEYCKRFGS